MNKRILFLGLFLFLSLSVVAAEDFGYNYLEGDLDIARAVNYSEVNVNNSQFLRGYTPTTLRDWFDTLYCKLTGCEMSGDINMNNNDILDVNSITSESLFSNFIGSLTNKITKIFTQDIEVSGKINLTNSTYNNQIYTNENGTLIIKSQNGETRFY
jgi:hypothetical protein